MHKDETGHKQEKRKKEITDIETKVGLESMCTYYEYIPYNMYTHICMHAYIHTCVHS